MGGWPGGAVIDQAEIVKMTVTKDMLREIPANAVLEYVVTLANSIVGNNIKAEAQAHAHARACHNHHAVVTVPVRADLTCSHRALVPYSGHAHATHDRSAPPQDYVHDEAPYEHDAEALHRCPGLCWLCPS